MGAQTKKAAAYAAASLLFFDEIPDDLTADFVEQDHGQCQQTLGEDVGGSGKNRGSHEGGEDDEATFALQSGRTDQSHFRQNEQRQRKVEDEAEGQHQGDDEAEIIFHGNQGLSEISAEAEEESESLRDHHEEGQRAAGDEKRQRRQDKDGERFSVLPREGRHKKCPKLVKNHRRSDGDASGDEQFEIHEKGLCGLHEVQRARRSGQQMGEVVDEELTEQRPRRHGADGPEKAPPQFIHVPCQCHAGFVTAALRP